MFHLYEQLIQGLLDKDFESVDNWLEPEELVGLRKSLLAHYDNAHFYTAGIGNKDNLQTLEKIRNDRIRWVDPLLANPCEKKFFEKIQGFVAYLNRTCYTGITSFEFQYAVYTKGSFYKKHVDQFQNDGRRQFSIVFYLTENWEEGDGGELLLYAGKHVTKIEPIPGRMVFFKSDIPHEVLTSHHERLSLTGWMKSI